jgi:hypothetical protein
MNEAGMTFGAADQRQHDGRNEELKASVPPKTFTSH